MSVGRISTLGLQQVTLRDAIKAQALIADQQGQISSHQKSQDFAGLGGSESEQFLLLENKIAKTSLYVSNNNIALTRVNTTDNILSQVIETASSLQSIISQRRNAASDHSAFPENIKGAWQNLAGQLNTSLEGRYLFAGTRTDTQPVNTTDFPTLKTDGVPDDGYYQGSKSDISLRADDNIDITYNVRADDAGIQKIFAGLAMAKKGDANNSDVDLQKAYDLITQGLQGVISARAIVNQNKVSIDNINTQHDSLKLYFTGVKEEMGNSDILSLSTQVSVNQGILQAAFQSFSKINSLRLSDYLK